ncbi:MAG TPA: hypothetical protein VIV58_17950 [Kofleriaceae bacterium]
MMGANALVDVFPASGYVGRTMKVVLAGNDTTFDTSSTVSFGTGVTVSAITVTGPDSLEATLKIDPTAALGKVDVAVTTAGKTISLPQSFELDAPVEAAASGTFEQGSLDAITITNKDLLNPFDTTTDANGNFTNVTVTSGDPSVRLTVSNVTESEITLNALIDVNATTTGAITIQSGSLMSPVSAVAVAPRTAQVITPGTPANFTVAGNGSLLQVTADAAGLLNLELTTTDTMMASNPGFALLPASGKWSDLIVVHENFAANAPAGGMALDNRVVAAGDKFYLVSLELGLFGAPGYMATINAKTVSLAGLTTVADTGDNSTPAKAQALTGTVAEFDGTLTDKTDVDCFKVTTAVNKKIHVYTTDDDGKTDSIAQIFANATQTTLTTPAPINASDDADYGDDMVTASLAAGTRAICVSASTAVQSITNGAYKAYVVIE